MSTLIFDIETVGEDYGALDEVTKKTLTRWVDRSTKDKLDKEALYKDIETGLGFSPMTGYIVAIGVYDLERQSGAVYYTGKGNEEDEIINDFVLKQRTERRMLEEFWDGAKHYDTIVTFNGRAFDAPFLYHRSVANFVKPTRNFLEGRYPNQQKSCRHVDLLDELTFFGAMNRKPSLHLFCRTFDIKSPKTDVCGDNVTELFIEKKFRDIAIYNANDVRATKELYLKWQKYLDFSKNISENQGEEEVSYD